MAKGKIKNKTQKLIIILLLAILLIIPTKTNAAEKYTAEGGLITAYEGDPAITETIIPEIVDGQQIKGIAEKAFKGNTTLTNVIIPGHVETINQLAFKGCPNLTQIEIKDGVKQIGNYAFEYCIALTNVTIPGSVTDIGSGAFAKSSSLSTIKIEEGVTAIGSKAFSNLDALSSVELPESITGIASNAFESSKAGFSLKAPQYKIKDKKVEETEVSKLAKSLETSLGITYLPTNYLVKITQAEGGTIKINKPGKEPQTTPLVVNEGETVEITLEISPEYKKTNLTYKPENGTEIEITGTQITTPASNIEITAQLEIIYHQITSTAGANGTIEPTGITDVIQTRNQNYTITPAPGYTIETLKIDGEEIAPQKTYTFTNVTEPHKIDVTFRELGNNTLEIKMSNIITATAEVEEETYTVVSAGGTNFISWLLSGIEEQNSRNFNFYMPNNDVKITYTYKEPVYNTATLESTSTTIDEGNLSDLIAIAKGDTVKLEITENVGEEAEITLAKTNIDEIIAKGTIEQLKVETEIGTLSIQKDALETIAAEASGTDIIITIKECDASDLTEEQKNIVGNRPVYKFEITSNGSVITEFNGNIVVTLPYSLSTGENKNGITVYYIDEAGNTEQMKTIYNNGTVSFTTTHFSEYYIKNVIEEQETPENKEEVEENEKDQEITEDKKDENKNQTTTSKKKKRKNKAEEVKVEETQLQEVKTEENKEEIKEEIELNFSDVKENAWYVDAVKYAVKNNIASGTSETTFSPNLEITRGQAITMICKTYKIEEETEGENFIDAGNTYYTGYIQALKNKGLISGTGENKVEPKREITRQEILVLLYNIIKQTNQLEETESNNQEITFTDWEEVSSWATNAVEYFIGRKIIVGTDGKINPKGNTTRAEMVQMIYNLNKE